MRKKKLFAGIRMVIVLLVCAMSSLLIIACANEQSAVTNEPAVNAKKKVPQTTDDQKDATPIEEPTIVFTKPLAEKVISGPFEVSGKTNLKGTQLFYTFEDGHNQLAKGTINLAETDTEWRTFEFQMTFAQPSSPYGTLMLYDTEDLDAETRISNAVTVQFTPELLADAPQ